MGLLISQLASAKMQDYEERMTQSSKITGGSYRFILFGRYFNEVELP